MSKTKSSGAEFLTQRFTALQKRCQVDKLSSYTDDELRDLVQDLYRGKAYYKSIELTTKRLSNSIYGGFGTSSLRYFKQELAETICAEGRHYTKMMNKVANKFVATEWATDTDLIEHIRSKPYGILLPDDIVTPAAIHKDMAVYGDTDSLYLRGDYILQSLGISTKRIKNRDAVELLEYIITTRFDPKFNEALETTITSRGGKNVMKFELELIGGKGIFANSKKYIMTTLMYDGVYIGNKGQFKSTGIEIQQSGSSQYVHDVLKSFVNTIFSKWDELNERTFFSMCAALRKQLGTTDVEDLAKIGRVKLYDKYIINDRERIELVPSSGASAAVKGAAKYNHLIYTNKLQNKYPYIKEGMRVKWYYCKDGGTFTYPVDEFPREIMPTINVDTQLEKLIFNPIKRLVDGLVTSNLSQMGKSKVQFGFNVVKKHSKK